MLKAIVFGLAAGAGFQAWRNYPPDQAPTAASMCLVFLVAIVAAYAVGRGVRHVRGPVASAVAMARASARAQSVSASNAQVQVNLFQPTAGAGMGASDLAVPDVDQVEWIRHREQLQHQDLDGMDLSELVEASEIEVER